METALIVAFVSAVAALAAVAAAVLALMRTGGAKDQDVLERQIPAALDALRGETRSSLEGAALTLNQRMAQLSAEVDRRLTDVGGEVGRRLESTSGMIGERLEGAARAVAEVHEKLGTVQGAAERVLEIGKDIASLQQILRSPKLRGGLGELFLGELLAQTLPPKSFEMQFAFRSGQRVDAIVRVGERIVPVDAKFPLENFTRLLACEDDAARSAARRAFLADVRRRIDEIAARYIVPDEGTFDFALMYVPAENVYYETIVRDMDGNGGGIYEYCLHRRVVPVSPNTLYSYLQVILLGLRGLTIEQKAHEILRGIGGLQSDLDRFRQEFAILGKHLEDASKRFAEGSRKLQKVQDSVGVMGAIGEAEDGTGKGRAADLAATPAAGETLPLFSRAGLADPDRPDAPVRAVDPVRPVDSARPLAPAAGEHDRAEPPPLFPRSGTSDH